MSLLKAAYICFNCPLSTSVIKSKLDNFFPIFPLIPLMAS